MVGESGLVDLQLLKDIRAYPDKVIGTAAEKAVYLHLWYLSEELYALAMFSS